MSRLHIATIDKSTLVSTSIPTPKVGFSTKNMQITYDIDKTNLQLTYELKFFLSTFVDTLS